MSAVNIIPEPGERALVVGQTGSGKSVFVIWLLQRIKRAPIYIYDTKDEPKFRMLPANVLVENMAEALKYKNDEKVDYVIVRPPVELMGEPKILDEMLWFHYLNLQQCPAYIDEAYTFQINGRAGKGLIALLTRGRSKGITTIISSQRPVRLDRFCITEAQKIYVLAISDKADKKRLDDIIPNFSDLPKPSKHGFYFFEVGMDNPVLFKAIELDRKFDTGYVDNGAEPTGENIVPRTEAHNNKLWL